MTLVESAREKPGGAIDERATIKFGGTKFDEPSVNEIAGFNRRDWRWRDLNGLTRINRRFPEPIFVNEDRAALRVDFPCAFADAHTD
jgi:hypothetical protein